MSAYFAPAFLGYLLGKCLRRKHPIFEICKLGFAVLGTFAVIWFPYLHSLEAFSEASVFFHLILHYVLSFFQRKQCFVI